MANIAVTTTTGESLYSFPLTDATIAIKTVQFNKNTVQNYEELRLAMLKPSPAGYCQGLRESMTAVSNQALCAQTLTK